MLSAISLGAAVQGGRDAVAQFESISIAADARIDNLDELKAELGARPAESAARILIRAYLKWGDLFPDRLVGDFALILWDARQRRILATRDPFGVRPLFYRTTKRGCCFASHTTNLISTLSEQADLDDGMVVEYLLWRFKTQEATFFREIREVRAGHVLTMTAVDRKTTRYWFPPAPRLDLEGRSRDEVFEELRSVFRKSVLRRIRSENPVVIHVSGGLDSPSIATAADGLLLAGHQVAPGLVGASAVYPGLEGDESRLIDTVARHIHFPVERWDGTRSNPIDIVAPAREAPGSRMTTTSGTEGDIEIAQRHNATVILSGIAGDDLMAVFGFTRDLLSRGAWRGAWGSISPPGAGVRTVLGRVRMVAAQFLPTSVQRFRARTTADVPEWLSPQFHRLSREIATDDATDFRFSSHVRRNIWKRLTGPQGRRSIGSMQAKAMPLGKEYRYPFLDRELVDFVFSIPATCLPGPVKYARIHREAFRSMLPPEIVDNLVKAELTPVVKNRVLQALPRIERLLTQGPWASERYVNRAAANRFLRVVAGPAKVQTRDWWRIWRIATLEAWLRTRLGYSDPS